ncbi:Tryptophan transporter TrpP [Bacillus sp. OV322]|uniref:tryptophan transporter n=1 Tax=Bacillus sp. OV322 TaxID=1882764 RepID=UPI0008EE7AFE|nr:tryptophan transporter [Bacillus sp. OV322]SFB95619.1 Tryptophan transporter TrpP [Bacillus sp. OV322]
MNIRTLVSLALFVGIGAALHVIIPGFFLGMKPDMMLTMSFLAIILFPEKKNVFLVALAGGIISGLTSTFPGGFIPNVIDKFVTCFVFYFMFIAARKFSFTAVNAGILTAIGTLVSGTVFLGSAYLIVGLPGAFVSLFAAVVLPAVLLNTVAMVIIYPIVSGLIKKSSLPANV